MRHIVFCLALLCCKDALAQIQIAPETLISGAIDNANDVDVYEFDTPVDTNIFVERKSATNQLAVKWKVVDSFSSTIVEDSASLSHLGPTPIMGEASSRHRLVVESDAGGTSSYSFIVHLVSPTTEDVSLGTLVTTSIDVPGRVRSFRFTPTVGELFSIDVQAVSVNVDMQLVYEDAVVIDRRQSLTDMGPFAGLGTEVVLTLTPTNNTVIASLPFVVRQVAAEKRDIALNAVVDGRAGFGGESVYRFDVAANGDYALDVLSTTGLNALAVTIFDHDDRVVAQNATALADLPGLALAVGSYRVHVKSDLATTADFQFRVSEVVHDASSIGAGDLISDVLPSAFGTHTYAFDATPNSKWVVDVITAPPTADRARMSIVDELGRVVLDEGSGFIDRGPIRLMGGSYFLVVDAETDARSAYEFVLHDVIDSESAMTIPLEQSASITQPGQSRRFTFDVVTPTSFTFDVTAVSDPQAVQMQVQDSVGRTVISTTSFIDTTFNLSPGQYAVVVSGVANALASFRFQLVNNGASSFTPTGVPLAFATLTSGSIGVAGEEDRMTFTATQDAIVFFNAASGATGLTWRLLDGGGNRVFNGNLANGASDQGPFHLAQGTYTLAITHISQTALYSFTAINVAADDVKTVALNSQVTHALTAFQASDDVLTLNTDARVFFNSQNLGAATSVWSIIDEAGVVVDRATFFVTADLGPHLLKAGTYRIRIENNQVASDNVAYTVHTADTTTRALTFANPITQSIVEPGQAHHYTFASADQGAVFVDLIAGGANVKFTLRDATARVIATRSGTDVGPIRLEQGTYVLEVTGVADSTPTYTFSATRADVIAENALFGTVVARNFSSPAIVDIAITTGQAEKAYFDLVSVSNATVSFVDGAGVKTANADRDVFMLPAGTHRAIVRAEANSQITFSLVDVVDRVENVAVGDFADAAYASVGGTVTYSFLPDDNGQPVTFDVMIPSTSTQTLVNPSGNHLFARGMVSVTTSDVGPLALRRRGSTDLYRYVVDGPGDDVSPYVVRLRKPVVPAPPVECASCNHIDMVFVFDTSLSMANNNAASCEAAARLVDDIRASGIDVTVDFLGIVDEQQIPCVTGNVRDLYGDVVPGVNALEFQSLSTCPNGVNGQQENFSLAAAVVAANRAWQSSAVRLIVPVADEAPFCGDPLDELDTRAINVAIRETVLHDVVVSPLLSDEVSQGVKALGEKLAIGTRGLYTQTNFAPDTLVGLVDAIATGACETIAEPVRPVLLSSSPAGNSTFASDTPFLLSGQVKKSGRLRPLVNVLVNSIPVDVIDETGTFFTTVQLQTGPNTFVIEAEEDCGTFELAELVLFGDTDGETAFARFQDASTSLRVHHSHTRFDLATDTFFGDVVVENTGTEPIDGPILYMPGAALSADVALANPHGLTPFVDMPAGLAGRPFVTMLDAATLAPGARTQAKTLAFSNPRREHVLYRPQLVSQANTAPLFDSVPLTRAQVGHPYRFAAHAIDQEQIALEYTLSVAPIGMQIDDDSGVVTMLPSLADVGVHDVVVVAHDGRGGRAILRFSLQVVSSQVNTPPRIVSLPIVHASVGSAYVYDVDVVDDDDTQAELTFALTTFPPSMTIDDEGRITYDAREAGLFDVEVSVRDSAFAQATQRFTLAVGEPGAFSNAPIIVSSPSVRAAVDELYLYQVIARDDGAVTFTLPVAPVGMSMSANGRITWRPLASQTGSHGVEVVVEDTDGQASIQSFTVDVSAEPIDNAPIFTTSPPSAAVVDTPLVATVAAIDPEGDVVTYRLLSAPQGAALDGVTGALRYVPTASDLGRQVIAIEASDSRANHSTQVFAVIVRANNQPPVFTSSPPTANVAVSGEMFYDVNASDADADVLTYALAQPDATQTIDATTGLLRFAPTRAGTHTLVVRVTDGFAVTEQTISVVAVIDTTDPTVVITREGSACLSQQIRLCVRAQDDVGLKSIAATIDDRPVALDAEQCVVRLGDRARTEVFKVVVTDVAAHTAEQQLSLTFAACTEEGRPDVVVHAPLLAERLQSVTQIRATISDDTPDNLSYTVQIARVDDDNYQTLSRGVGAKTNEVIGVIDTTRFANDVYKLRIEASDQSQTGGVEFLVSIASETKVGHFDLPFTDVNVPVAGLTMSVKRRYQSLRTIDNDFGVGWDFGLNGDVNDDVVDRQSQDLVGLLSTPAYTRSTRVYVTRPDGKRVGFTYAPTFTGFPPGFRVRPGFTPDPGVTDALEAVGQTELFEYGGKSFDFIIPYNPDAFILTTKEGVKYHLAERVGLTRIEDANGNTLTVSENGVVSSLGDALVIERDAQKHITRIIEPDDVTDALPPLVHHYAYDENSNLVSYENASGEVTRYFYEDAEHPHLLTRIEDPLGRNLIRNVYDDSGRLIATCPATGDLASMDGCERYAFDVETNTETFIDANGNRIDRIFDAAGDMRIERFFDVDGDLANALTYTRTYDANHNVTSVTDDAGAIERFTYDNRRNIISHTDASLRTTTRTFDPKCGKMTSECDAEGDCTRAIVDDHCNVIERRNELGAVTRYRVDARGFVTSFIDAEGQTTSYTYNQRGQMTSATDARGNVLRLRYDGRGNQIEREDRNGALTTLSYDDGHRLILETADGKTTTRTYDASGRVVSVTSDEIDVTLAYNNSGDIERVNYGGDVALSLTYQYDGNRNITSVTDSMGGRVSYRYDGFNRLREVTDHTNGARFDYDASQLLTTTTFDVSSQPIASVRRHYECTGCASRFTGFELSRGASVVEHVQLSLKNDNTMQSRIDNDGVFELDVDGRNRIVSFTTPSRTETYRYDDVDNRIANNGADFVYGYMSAEGGHTLLSTADETFEYDREGNMIRRTRSDGTTTAYAFNTHKQLVGVVLSNRDGDVVDTYELGYAPSGQLVRLSRNGVTTRIFYDGDNPILQTNASGQIVARRLYAQNVDHLIAETRDGDTHFFVLDQQSTVQSVLDVTGQVVARTPYSPFGDARLPQEELTAAFIGRDMTTFGLVNLRQRWYDPKLSRFVSDDPYEPFMATYVHSAPQTAADRTGKTELLEFMVDTCEAVGLILDLSSVQTSLVGEFGAVYNGLEGRASDPRAIVQRAADAIVGFAAPSTALPCATFVGNDTVSLAESIGVE